MRYNEILEKMFADLSKYHGATLNRSYVIEKIINNWADYHEEIERAFTFLEENNFIKPINSNGDYLPTTKYYDYKEKGILVFLQEQQDSRNVDKQKKDLEFTKLKEDVRVIKRNRIYWWIAAVMGVISFLLQVLKFFNVIDF
jgi:DNA-binding PadR family transcriptional regulator